MPAPTRTGSTGLFAEGPSPTVVGVVFRVGQVDEALPARGLTHLVEHTALWSIGERPFAVNGQVDLTSTTFVARGSVADIEAFVSDVGAALQSLPVHRVPIEARVLRMEGARSQSGPAEMHLALRFGAQTYGLPYYRELGLESLSGEDATAWSRFAFVAGNVACWAVGPDEPNLHLELPAGDRLPLPPLDAQLPSPRAVLGEPGSVSLSGITPRSAAGIFTAQLAARAAQRALRRERGVTYTVVGGYQPLTADEAHVLLSADAEDPYAGEVMHTLVDTLTELAAGKASQADQTTLVEEAIAGIADAQGLPGRLHVRALDQLMGRPTSTDQQLIDEFRAVTANDIAEVATAWLSSAILVAPDAAGEAPNSWSREVPRGDGLRNGRLYALRGTRPWNRHRYPRFDLSEQGIRFRSPESEVTIRWHNIVAGLWGSSGSRVLIAADGSQMTVEPEEWIRGRELVAEIDRKVSPGAWCGGLNPRPPALPTSLRSRPYVDS